MSLTRRSLLSAGIYGGFSLATARFATAEAPGVQATFVLKANPAPGRREPPVVTCLSIQPGGDLSAVGGDDHLLRIWNIRSGKIVHELAGHDDWIRAVQFIPGKDEIITAGNDRRLLRWTLAEGGIAHREIAKHKEAIACVSLNRDSDKLAATGFESQMSLYDLRNAQLVSRIACPCRDMRAAVFSPNGEMLAAAGRNGKIRLWAVDDLKHMRDIQGHRQRVRALAFSPDGRQLASASEDRTACIWNVTTGESIAKLSTGTAKIFSVVYLNDRHLATGGSDNTIRVWDLQTQELAKTLIGHTGSVSTLATADDVLVSGSYDTTVRVWHPLDGASQASRPLRDESIIK